jgi:hypothetical protein
MAITDKKKKYMLLEGIKCELTPLDTFLLDRLINLSRENICFDNGEKVNKKLVLLVGPSGSGKSTIILKVLGYDFE